MCVFIVLETDRVARVVESEREREKKRDATSKDKIKQNTDIKGLIHLLFVFFQSGEKKNQEDIQVKNTFFSSEYICCWVFLCIYVYICYHDNKQTERNDGEREKNTVEAKRKEKDFVVKMYIECFPDAWIS